MPKTDYDALDITDVILPRLDELIHSHIERLLGCQASEHDRIAGVIKGLGTAKAEIEAIKKKWSTRDADPKDGLDDGPPLPTRSRRLVRV